MTMATNTTTTTTNRNTEIWATRLQREFLALEAVIEGRGGGGGGESNEQKSNTKIMMDHHLLPSFITPLGHTLNIPEGIAKIEFRIHVEKGTTTREKQETTREAAGGGVAHDDSSSSNPTAHNIGMEGTEKTATDKRSELIDPDKQTVSDFDKTLVPTEMKGEEEKEKEEDDYIILVLDASLYSSSYAAPPSGPSYKNNGPPQCYPFQKPLAVLKSGSHLFINGGSTLHNGDEIPIEDLDWTPSIHLSDAATNVALKIRECIRMGEPLHPMKMSMMGTNDNYDDNNNEEDFSESILREAREAKETLLETKKAVASMLSSGLSSLTARGTKASKSMTQSLLYFGESLSSYAAESSSGGGGDDDARDSNTEDATASSLGGKTKHDEKKDAIPEEEEMKTSQKQKDIPDIGDEINLSDEPWNQCIGMYSCKAIRRPAFVEDAIVQASKERQSKETSSSRAGSMFSRFAQSAKSAMEETFLMITDKSIVEFKANRLNIGSGNVTFAIQIEEMAKLKFRREESLSLFFKLSPEDPLVYMCHDSALAVHDIQNVLKRHYGVKGKHTNAATQRAVQMALSLVGLIQQKEKELLNSSTTPSVDLINEIMDLYRQAAEKFESAGDPRHAEVLAHMKHFLNQQFTTSILDGSSSFAALSSSCSPSLANTTTTRNVESSVVDDVSPVPQGDILDQPTYNFSKDDDDDDDDDDKNENTRTTTTGVNDSTLQNMENMLEEAVKSMSEFGMDEDDIHEILTSPTNHHRAGKDDDNDDFVDHDETYAELDAMLSDADKELDELLNSS